MFPIAINLPRFLLRDFEPADQAAFVAYQMDPRYLQLYDFSDAEPSRAERLFRCFMSWREQEPRQNFQLGIFDKPTGRLLGSAGLRKTDETRAILGMELAPSEWGRFRLAVDIGSAMVDFGFGELQLQTITGDTASGNKRIEKLARFFGAEMSGARSGPEWMRVRGWHEVDWTLRRPDWARRKGSQKVSG